MADLIDRAALLSDIDEAFVASGKSAYAEIRGANKIIDRIKAAPAVDAEPVKHGEWEPSPHLYGYVRCSECHGCNVWGEWIDGKKWNYCPNCGAKMDGGKET